jgi:hypothetical protein
LATTAGRSTLKDAVWLVKSARPVPVTVAVDEGPLIDALKEKVVVVTAAAALRCTDCADLADLADLDEAPALPANPKVAPTPITPTEATTVSNLVLVRAIPDLLLTSAYPPRRCSVERNLPGSTATAHKGGRPTEGLDATLQTTGSWMSGRKMVRYDTSTTTAAVNTSAV